MLTGGHESLGHLSVITFFVISGYLITQSWNNQPKLMHFTWKRVLRIYPGVISTILFTTFLIGPLVTSLNIKEYLFNINILSVIKNTIVLSQGTLPGVFNDNIYPMAVNGSLWTLIPEVYMYLMTALFGLSGILKKKWPVIILTIMSIILFNLNILSSTPFESINKIPSERTELFLYYLVGMCYFLYKDKIKYNYTIFFLLLFTWLILFHTAFTSTVFTSIIAYISLPYIILFCAFTPAKYLHRAIKGADYSYGLYIYAFPIQQTIVHFSKNTVTPVELFIIAYPLTFFIAFLSLNYIEKGALKFKNKLDFENKDRTSSA